jgi:peptidyl-prolyl cis-trans isomerase D
MLSLMRKNAGNWIIKAVLFAIVVVFVFWGVGSFQTRNETQIAKVNGEGISYEQYRRSYTNLLEQYRRAYGGQVSEEMFKLLRPKETALNQLIERMIMTQEADRLNIQVTDSELDEAIRKIPAFQVEGLFDAEHATRLLAMNNYSTEEFRNSLKEDLRINKLRGLVLEGIFVTEDEIRRWYDWYNTEINLEYVNFAPERYTDVALNADEIKAYFDEHRDEYKTDPQAKVRFLQLKPEQFTSEVSVSPEEITRYYEMNPGEFKSEQTVEARHILIRVDSAADDQAVAQKKALAEKIYAMAKEGKDFSELAKEYSEDTTRDDGGNLGAFSRESMVKPFADQAFSMKAGEISPPVRTQFGWHIIKVEKVNAARTVEMAAASEDIRSRLVTEKARAIAMEKAETVFDNVFDGDDLSAAAQTYGLAARTTELFTRGNPPQDVGDPDRFAEVALGMEKMSLSEVLDLEDGIYLLQVIDRIEPEVPPLERVAEEVKADLLKQRQAERAKSEAEALLAEIAKGTPLSEAVTQRSLSLQETGLFKRTGSIPKLGYEPEIIQSAFKLSTAKPLHEVPLEARQGWYVIRLKDRRLPDGDGFAQEKDTLSNQLDVQKKQSAVQQWLADLKASSQIETNQKMLQ